MDLVNLVSNNDQRLNQNNLNNMLSRSDMMVFGSWKCTHTCSKKILVVALVVILFLQVVRMAILENQSTTMNTQSFPCLVEERPGM
jgi:hypothetical protein